MNYIQLKRQRRENRTIFDEVITLLNSGQILWKDKVLEKRASAYWTVEKAELRLFIDNESVQCFTDFTEYKCGMERDINSTLTVYQETASVTASNIHTCTCMYVYIKYDKSYSIEAVWGFIEWFSKERTVCAFYQAI